MNVIEYFNSPLCIRLVFTLAHFLWQGLAIALLALLAASLFGKDSSRIRYGIYMISLFSMLVACGVTYTLVGLPTIHNAEGFVSETTVDATESQPIADVPEASLPLVVESVGVPLVTPSFETVGPETPKSITSTKLHFVVDWRRYVPYAVCIYCLGVLVMFGRLLIGLHGGQRLSKFSEAVGNPAILSALVQRARAIGFTFTPAIAYCRRIIVPTVVGVLKPTILLPFSFASGLSTKQVEMLIVHELAHIRRHDPLFKVLQSLIEAVLFFHPAVWLISRKIHIERENCCDDMVIETGGRVQEYASSLVAMAQKSLLLASKQSMAIEGISVAGHPSRLHGRITRLMGNAREPKVRLRHTWVTGLVLAVIVGLSTASYIGNSTQRAAKNNGPNSLRPGISGTKPGSMKEQVAEIFKKVDELQERKKQRSTEYLSSLSDEKLAETLTKRTRNEDPLFALESVKKDRQRVVRILLERVVLTPEDKKAFAAEFDK
ncbi:MAG: M56 family metallopeptidase, partial [Planctomycetota bacterium]